MKRLQLFPNEHVYSGLIRYRLRSAQAYMSDKEFFAHNSLPYHWFKAQTPLSHAMKGVLDIIEPDTDKQFQIRLAHTPISPWFLSLPSDMNVTLLKDAGLRPNMEENPFQVDRRWKYCPHCATEQINQYGVSYWQAEHQLPGVLICRRHGTPLHSHEQLRYLSFCLPKHWLGKSQPLAIAYPWQTAWQPFIYSVCQYLQQHPDWGRVMINDIRTVLGVNENIRVKDRTSIDALFAQMQHELGEDCLRGLFSAYARNYQRKPNILWLTLTPGQKQGLRHPLYWLAILFWLKDRLPTLRECYEDGSATTF